MPIIINPPFLAFKKRLQNGHIKTRPIFSDPSAVVSVFSIVRCLSEFIFNDVFYLEFFRGEWVQDQALKHLQDFRQPVQMFNFMERLLYLRF